MTVPTGRDAYIFKNMTVPTWTDANIFKNISIHKSLYIHYINNMIRSSSADTINTNIVTICYKTNAIFFIFSDICY